MADIQVILPPQADETDPLEFGLVNLTRAISQIDPDLANHGVLGGEFGYGAHWDNDVFLMHPYCWCGAAGACPWCTGCAAFEAACKACSAPHPHTASCYQTELNQRRKSAGLSYILDDQFFPPVVHHNQAREARIEETIYREIAAKHGLDPLYGAAIHCDCGADASRATDIATNGCDYRFGRGIFARFAPWTLGDTRHYYDPPNFWHKPSGFRAVWYKWIGRDTYTNRDADRAELQRIFTQCAASLSGERREPFWLAR